jgi:Zn-dependent protease with chaperone function
VAVASRLCTLVLALIVAILMSPFYYAVIGLALDVVNWVVPMPDLIKTVTDTIGAVIDHPEAVTLNRGLYLGTLAALPGLVVMGLILRTLGRVMREAMTSEPTRFAARAPNGSVLAEQRFANVVAEMALAAGLASPRVLVADNECVNAAAFGADEAHATIIVTTGLLAAVNRAELQGVAAHVIGSIADGDMTIGNRVATTLGMFGLTAKLSGSFGDRDAARRFARLLRASFRHGSSDADGELAIALTNPFHDSPDRAPKTPSAADDPKKIPWRTLAWMPLVGPLVLSGFFGGMVSSFLLGPLLALIWRRRKYMADATAVRLTRDPEALAGALQKMRGMPVEGAFSAWTAHMAVAPDTAIRATSIFSGASVRMAPSLNRRLKALGVMGAHVDLRAERQMPFWAWCVLVPVGALLIGLMSFALFLLVYLSVALSGMFTWLPAILLHVILR